MMALFPTMRIFAAALVDTAFAAIVGALFNRLWLGRVGICDLRLKICLRICSAILLVVLPLQFLLLSASMIGDTSWTDAWHAVPDVAATHSGHAMIMSWAFVPLLSALSFFPALLQKLRNINIALGASVGFIACRALWGHAASDGDFTLREGVQFLHLSSIAIWGGGILVAGIVTVPKLASGDEQSHLEQFGKRLSRTVTVSLAIVMLSGIYNLWKGLGGALRPLPESPWGWMLLLKLFFVLIALGHGMRARFLLKTRDGWTQSRSTIFRSWLRAEALIMLLILICSGWLANLPPGGM